jgi:TolB-like protein
MAAGDPYFAEGVAEEIANQLGREPQFKVAGRTSSALFKDAADLRDVGRRLHVAYILEGSVRSAGDQVRVAVSLVNTKNGARMWSQDFRGSLDDIFAIQDSIGQQVAAHVKRRLVAQTASGDALKTTGDVYSLYVTARSLIRTREPAKLSAAVDLLQRAVKLDPNYAPAWARLAQALHMSRFYGHEYEPMSGRTRPDELEAVQRAVSLAPGLAEAQAVVWLLSDAPNMSKDMKQRGRLALERAVKLDPTDSQSWYWLYIVREKDLDFEGALAAVRRTAEIDPFFTFSDKYAVLAWDMGERAAATRFMADRIRDHPDPYIRERSREILANVRADWSAVYGHLKRVRELASPDMRPYSNLGMGLMLMRVGLIDAARPHFEDPWVLDLWTGKPPPPEEVRGLDPDGIWRNLPVQLLTRVLINNGRAAEIVSLYDRAFDAPGEVVERTGKLEFVTVAPVAASALREVGRNDEAMILLTTADGLCAAAMKRGRTPMSFQVDCSRSAAMLGRTDESIQMLERALRTGWRPEGGWSYRFVDEPVYRTMRDDPRLKRLGAFVLAENARERRELLAAGV